MQLFEMMEIAISLLQSIRHFSCFQLILKNFPLMIALRGVGGELRDLGGRRGRAGNWIIYW